MSFLAPLDVSDPGLGGKARSLARLAALGLPTPAAFVAKDDLFRALCPDRVVLAQLDDSAIEILDRIRSGIDRSPWPPAFPEELDARLRAMGDTRFAVRSSFASEDCVGALAAGVYESRVDVAFDDVAKNIRRVLRSAMSLGAAAYAMAHGRNPGEAPVAVLVHVFVPGDAEGSAAFVPGGIPELMVRRGRLSEAARAELQAGLERVAQELGPVEVEWVLSARGLVYLQARPFQPKPAIVEWSGWKDLPPSAGERDDWRWDMAHNPLPVSPAQAGLVDLVDEQCQIGIRQRVLGGYLFHARDARPLPPAISPESAMSYFDHLRREVDARLASLGPYPALDDALSFFVDVYQRIFGVLQPALKRARHALREFLAAHAPEELPLLPDLLSSVPSVATERRKRVLAIAQANSEAERARARAAYQALFGDEAPVWDVSARTYAEDASPLCPSDGAPSDQRVAPDWRAASLAVQARMPEREREQWRAVLTLARDAVSLSEADDWLYARVQASVRRALLSRGEALRASGRLSEAEEVFFLPLRLLREMANEPVAGSLAEVARAGLAAWQAALKDPPATSGTQNELVVHGHGTGGHAIGRIAVHHSGSFLPGSADTVLLCQTLLPTELPLISAAAIVTETGGPLDHVAAQARERGIPAVIGAIGAGRALREGDLVLVDGERGLVVSLRRDRPHPPR